MATELQAKISLDAGNAANTMGNLRTAIKDAKNELYGTVEGTDANTQAMIKLANATSKYREVMRDVKALDPKETFRTLSEVTRGLTAGFESLAGITTLLGNKNEELEQQLKKVSSAILVFHGLQEFVTGMRKADELIKAFTISMKASAVATEEGTVATSLFNRVLAANPIGVTVLAVAALTAAFVAYKVSTDDAADSEEALRELNKKALDNINEEFSKVTLLVGVIRDENSTKKEKKKAVQDLIDQHPNYFGNLKDESTQVKKLTEDYQHFTEAILEDAKAKAAASIIQEKQKELFKIQIEQDEQQKELAKNNLSIFVGDATAYNKVVTDNGNERIKKLQDEIDKYVKLGVTAQQNLDKLGGKIDIDKPDVKKDAVKKDTNDVAKLFHEMYYKILAEQIKFQEEFQKQEDAFIIKGDNTEKTGRQKELDDLTRHYNDLLTSAILAGKDTSAITESFREQQLSINQKYDNAENVQNNNAVTQRIAIDAAANQQVVNNQKISLDQRKALLTDYQLTLDNQFKQGVISETEYTEKSKNLSNARIQIKRLENEAERQYLDAGASILNSAAQLAGESTDTGKALAIASTLISTYSSAQKAYESAFLPVPNVSSPALGAVYAAVAIASGLARIAAIERVDTNSKAVSTTGVSIGSSAPLSYQAPQIPTSTTYTQLDQNTINQLNNAQGSQRVYVLQSDIQDSTNTVNSYVSQATIGGNH